MLRLAPDPDALPDVALAVAVASAEPPAPESVGVEVALALAVPGVALPVAAAAWPPHCDACGHVSNNPSSLES
jgi:hypothetical protein